MKIPPIMVFLWFVAMSSVCAEPSQGFTVAVNVAAEIGTFEVPEVYLAEDEVVFSVPYDSRGDWDCSIFDPPNGSTFKILSFGGIRAGKGTLVFAIPAGAFTKISEVTSILDFSNRRGTIFFKLTNGLTGLRKRAIPSELASSVVRDSSKPQQGDTPKSMSAGATVVPASETVPLPGIVMKGNGTLNNAEPDRSEIVGDLPQTSIVRKSTIGKNNDGRLVGHWTGVSWANDWVFFEDGTGTYQQQSIRQAFEWTTSGDKTLIIPVMNSNVSGAKNDPTYRFANGHLFLRKFSGAKKVWFEDEYKLVTE